MDNKPSKEISRRDAMKILAAVVGATTLANIPDKWTKPDMELGVLPAHAQTSMSPHTMVAGADDPAANFCWPLDSSATLTPATPGIVMRYVVTTTGDAVLNPPAVSTGTVPTDALGVASLSVLVSLSSFNSGDTVTITWSFEPPSDGIGSDAQVFTSAGSGC